MMGRRDNDLPDDQHVTSPALAIELLGRIDELAIVAPATVTTVHEQRWRLRAATVGTRLHSSELALQARRNSPPTSPDSPAFDEDSTDDVDDHVACTSGRNSTLKSVLADRAGPHRRNESKRRPFHGGDRRFESTLETSPTINYSLLVRERSMHANRWGPRPAIVLHSRGYGGFVRLPRSSPARSNLPDVVTLAQEVVRAPIHRHRRSEVISDRHAATGGGRFAQGHVVSQYRLSEGNMGSASNAAAASPIVIGP
jgi:hypothetical protein